MDNVVLSRGLMMWIAFRGEQSCGAPAAYREMVLVLRSEAEEDEELSRFRMVSLFGSGAAPGGGWSFGDTWCGGAGESRAVGSFDSSA